MCVLMLCGCCWQCYLLFNAYPWDTRDSTSNWQSLNWVCGSYGGSTECMVQQCGVSSLAQCMSNQSNVHCVFSFVLIIKLFAGISLCALYAGYNVVGISLMTICRDELWYSGCRIWLSKFSINPYLRALGHLAEGQSLHVSVIIYLLELPTLDEKKRWTFLTETYNLITNF